MKCIEMSDLNNVLNEYLEDCYISPILNAIEYKWPILIKGIRKPTGKSTICEIIRKYGGNVVEEWETEEGAEKQTEMAKHIKKGNSCYLVINLNKVLV